MRRLRHPLAAARRRAHRVLRPASRSSTAARSRPGIAVSDSGRLTVLRDMGLVSQVFDEQNLSGLQGDAAIGHTRYSTTGSTQWANAQPLLHHGRARTIALGHNGNLTNASALRAQLADDGVKLSSTSDSELIAALIASDSAPLEEAVAGAMAQARGRILDRRALGGHAARVPRPARFPPARARPARRRVGRRLGDLRARPRRRRLRARGRARRARRSSTTDGLRSVQAVEPAEHGALCIFEFFYLARPDTRLEGVEVHARARADGRAARCRGAGRRRSRAADPRLGHARGDRLLPRDRDSVQRGPDQEPLRRRGRSSSPTRGCAQQGIKLKFNPLAEVAGKRVVAVDDSIVRGNTTRQIVQMLFDAGAAEVHVRVSAPPVIGRCFYGIDFADPAELIACGRRPSRRFASTSARPRSRTCRSRASSSRRAGRRRSSAAPA